MDEDVEVARSHDGFSISFAPTAGELWGAGLWVNARSTKQLVVNFLLFPAVLAFAVTLIARADFAYGLVTFVIYIALFVLIFVAGLAFRYRAKSDARQWRTIRFNEEGLTASLARQVTQFQWQAFGRRYIRRDGLILTFGTTTRSLLIPNRAFKSPEEAASVRALVETNVGKDVR